jgi:hypothetical protein
VFHSKGYYAVLFWMSLTTAFFLVCMAKYWRYSSELTLNHLGIIFWHLKMENLLSYELSSRPAKRGGALEVVNC